MAEISTFKSRTGKIDCAPAGVFDFVTDIRNFRQFVPEGVVGELMIEKEECTFNFSPIGNVNLKLVKKEPVHTVIYEGTLLKSNDFTLYLNINGPLSGTSDVQVILSADLNPVLKMMAAKPVSRFLEILIDEMEKFKGWNNTKA